MKRIFLTAAILLGSVTAASAATVSVSPGDWVNLEAGSDYQGGQAVVPKSNSSGSKRPFNFSHSYGFSSTITDLLFSGDLSSMASGRGSIKNLVFTWKDRATKEIVASIKVTDGRGVVINGGINTVALLAGHDYKLNVKGFAKKPGGKYSFAAEPQRYVEPAPVPVPGALMLLAPALMGLAVLGRRKRSPVA